MHLWAWWRASRTFSLAEHKVPDFPSFKCFEARCLTPEALLIVSIYRPPRANSNSITDFSNLLTTICPTFSRLVVLGDFKIHVDDPRCTLAVDFFSLLDCHLSLLDCLPLIQHVQGPTHKHCHPLDLVVTGDVPISNTHILELDVSDHYVVLLDAMITPPASSSKCSITFSKTKDIDHTLLTCAFSSALSETHSSLSLKEHVHCYNSTLHDGLHRFADEKTQLMSFQHPAPWYNHQLRSLKSEGRRIERRLRQTGLIVHHLPLRQHRKM